MVPQFLWNLHPESCGRIFTQFDFSKREAKKTLALDLHMDREDDFVLGKMVVPLGTFKNQAHIHLKKSGLVIAPWTARARVPSQGYYTNLLPYDFVLGPKKFIHVFCQKKFWFPSMHLGMHFDLHLPPSFFQGFHDTPGLDLKNALIS